jgi:LmbE family N-acetylglucosaminyl deacetylase
VSARAHRLALAVAAVLAPLAATSAQAPGAGTGGTVALRHEERMLGHTKRVLMIAAHPDDEDTELLTLLVRGQGAEAAYLSLSRGEGGQNLIGSELGEELGLLRTEELLAARRLDGARQYFTRAFDFGFSKTLAEASLFWPPDSLLKDAVRVVRRFRPQILITIFSGTPRDGHGQHQAAGWVAREVFTAAGDSARFPELLREEGLRPWAPLKLYRTVRFDTTGGASTVLEGGVLDPDVGQSYRQVAMRGRSLHRSQDMGVLQDVGPSPIRLQLVESRGAAQRIDEFWGGIDTTEITSGTGIEADDARRHRAEAAATRAGLVFDATTTIGRLLAGEAFELQLTAWNAGAARARVELEVRVPEGWIASRGECPGAEAALAPGAVRTCTFRVVVPADAPPTTPYFLRKPRAGAQYRWDAEPALRGEPFEPPLVGARFAFSTDEATHSLEREVVHRYRDQAIGEVRRPLAVVPRVAVGVEPGNVIWPLSSREARTFSVTLQHTGRDSTRGTVTLDLPAGWPPVAPQPFRLTRDGERETLLFEIRPPAALSAGTFAVRAVASDHRGRRYDTNVITIDYPHIRQRLMVRPAAATIRGVNLRAPAVRRIGYVRGAADRVPEALIAMGLPVDLLDAVALERHVLGQYDVIVIGSRAYEIEPALAENNARLLEYVARGGRLIVQYQQLDPYFRGRLSPRPLSLTASLEPIQGTRLPAGPARVSDETAPVRALDPASPLFHSPNRLGPDDWDGWVQERGLYFAGAWDPAYRPLLELADPGEPARQGALLVLPHGRGTYVYTGLSFFRQLPAGVPGAVRLFLNLLSLRATPSSR